jgi:hypothetical protein
MKPQRLPHRQLWQQHLILRRSGHVND